MDIPATEVLQTYTLASLQQMARQRNLDKPKNKVQAVEPLARVLYDPASIKAALDDLTPLERILLDRVLLAGGETATEIVRLTLEREELTDRIPRPAPGSATYWSQSRQQKGSARNRGSRSFPDLVARLGVLGLVFTAEPVRSGSSLVELNEPGRRLYIPEAILRHLPAAELAPTFATPPSNPRKTDPARLLRDYYLMLSFAAREPIPLTARGLLLKRVLVRVDSVLSQPEVTNTTRTEEDLTILPFVRALSEELGHLAATAGELVLDERAEAFLGQPTEVRQQRLFEAWRGTTRWNELFRIPSLSVRGKGMSLRTVPPGVVAARQRVLTELAELPAEEWIPMEHLVERLRLRAYEFLLPRRWNYNTYYSYGYGGYGADLPNPYPSNKLGLTFDVRSEQAGWDIVEAGFVRAIVSEALFALGAVDLGKQGRHTTAFRINADGARLLHNDPLPPRPVHHHVIVQPNFQIFAMEPTGEDILFRLDQIADRLRADQAFEYELTRDSIYRAQRTGSDTAAIVEFLESISSVGLPQNVQRTIEEWGTQHERITIRPRTPVLHALDENLLDELYADPELAQLLGRRVAPTVALVSSEHLQPLLDQLLEHRQVLPALTEGASDQPTPAVVADNDDFLRFHQHVPSIFHLWVLRPFADVESGGMRLSPESLRRGAKTGLDAEDILATVELLHAGPLPEETAALVRRWAKDWGQGALVEATLFQVDQPETLESLMADPDARPFLQPVPGAPTLALVRAGSVDRLRALLDERGMSLVDHLID